MPNTPHSRRSRGPFLARGRCSSAVTGSALVWHGGSVGGFAGGCDDREPLRRARFIILIILTSDTHTHCGAAGKLRPDTLFAGEIALTP
jgi:hypothetical protein